MGKVAPLWFPPVLELSGAPPVVDLVWPNRLQAVKAPRKVSTSIDAYRFINTSSVPCRDSLFLTPQRAGTLSRISDLELLLVRILRFYWLRRNELASKANSCGDREILSANS